MVKPREDMTGWIMKEHGFPNSRLTVLYQTDDYIDHTGRHYVMYHCICDCENHKELDVSASRLRSGNTQSCGCIHKEKLVKQGEENRKYNIWIDEVFTDEYGDYRIGLTSNTNKEFYVDAEDYDIVKDYCWNEHKMQGKNYYALEARDPTTKKIVRISWVLGYKGYDHKDRNPLNNRKSNFRKCTNSENTKNRNKPKSNTSGFIGVTFNTANQVWVARINDKPLHRIVIYRGTNKQDAIIARLKAEAKYYGEFAPQRHLFEQYGIEVE